MNYKYLFGPVPSRRLGLSLGVDLFPSKICSYDCPYCECGATKVLTAERREYVPTERVLAELKHFLDNSPKLDYVTFAGQGEPTLHIGLEQLISFVKNHPAGCKVAVLSNGAHFHDPEVRKAVINADLICPSLDAVTPEAYSKINKAAPGLSIDAMIDGLSTLSQEFLGTFYLEIFILEGFNDSPQDILALKEALHKIQTQKIQLNTLDRPGAMEGLKPASPKRLQEIAQTLDMPQVEIIAKQAQQAALELKEGESLSNHIVQLIRRRPMTLGDLENVLTEPKEKLETLLKTLCEEQKLQIAEVHGQNYYQIFGKKLQ